MNLNSILIGTDDIERLTGYYTQLFGEPAWNMEGYVGWVLGSGAFTVGAHDQVTGKNVHPGRIIWNIESADVQADFARLKAAGATVVKEPYSIGEADDGWVATFADPDNNYFQLMSPMQAD